MVVKRWGWNWVIPWIFMLQFPPDYFSLGLSRNRDLRRDPTLRSAVAPARPRPPTKPPSYYKFVISPSEKRFIKFLRKSFYRVIPGVTRMNVLFLVRKFRYAEYLCKSSASGGIETQPKDTRMRRGMMTIREKMHRIVKKSWALEREQKFSPKILRMPEKWNSWEHFSHWHWDKACSIWAGKKKSEW